MTVLTNILIACAAATFAAYFLLRFHRAFAQTLEAFRRLPSSQKAVLVLAVSVATVCAQKSGTDGVDGVTEIPPPRMSFRPPTSGGAPVVDLADVARGYRLESVTTNVPLVTTDVAVVSGTWHLRGAYADVLRQELGSFVFPLGTNLCRSLWVGSRAWVRARLSDVSNEIAVVGRPLSALPDVSRFWSATTSNDTCLLTWENFVSGRHSVTNADPPAFVSAQLELLRNGDFVTRSDGVESVCRRIDPDDWDGDGLPNGEDDDPLTCAGDFFGPRQDLSIIGNSNAYCWVDVVVPRVNARVTFLGEGSCDLPDPSFIARADETNRVVLLIGKEYRVRCGMPFEIVATSDPEVGVWDESPTERIVYWPVEIEAWEGNGNSFRMHVVPSGLGGEFVWTNACCSIFGSGNVFTYGCDKNCLCTGCSARGYFEYEGFSIGCDGASCGCSSSGEWIEDGDFDESPKRPGVSVYFSKRVVLFEDAYTNSYGRPVPGQSTVTRLTIVAYGGEHGGDLTMTLAGIDKLTRIAGAELPPGSVSVAPHQTRTYKVDYHGKKPSEGMDDITASALLVENDTNENYSDDDSLTSVRIKSHVYCSWIPWTSRKEVGVGEKVVVYAQPEDDNLGLYYEGCQTVSEQQVFVAPHRACSHIVSVGTSEASLALVFQVLEPTGFLAVDYDGIWGAPAGTAGNFSGIFTVYVMPTNVSLTAIEKREIGCVATDAVGIFANPEYQEWLDHSAHGAGDWHGLNSRNMFIDGVSFAVITNWGGNAASFTWPIPNVWRMRGVTAEVEFSHDSGFDQRFEIDADGTSRIKKFHWIVERATNLTHSARRAN